MATNNTVNHAPVGLAMEDTGALVEHISTGTTVGRFSGFDLDGDTLSFKLIDDAAGMFKLEGNALIVVDGSKLGAKDYSVKVQATDGHGGAMTGEFTIEVQSFEDYHKFDHGPFGIGLSYAEKPLYEHTKTGTIIGDFSAYNNDQVEMTYSLVDDAGGIFKLDGAKLVVADGSKLEAKQYSVIVKVIDANGATGTAEFFVEAQVPGKTLLGKLGKDVLVGRAGDDILKGGLGNDVLKGGLGKDMFVFNTKLSSKNVDKIADFSTKDDTIQLENAIFKNLGSKTGALKKAFFTIGDQAHNKNQHLIYNAKTGALSYDADGNGSGAAVKFAVLEKNLKMTAADFFVI